MTDELLILHGLQGGQKMATSYWDARTGRYVTRSTRRRRKRVGALGNLASFGQATGLKGTVSSVKGVVITGAIAASGAIVTDQVFEKIGANLNLVGWKRDLAKIATGIALGILIAKILKKPRIAAAFAIGPIVAGLLNIFGDVMSGSTAGLGLTAFQPVGAYNSMYAPLYGTSPPALGLNTFQTVGPSAYPGRVPAAPGRRARSVPLM